MTDPLKDYVGVDYVARKFEVERQTVRLWAKDGRIPSVRKGRNSLLFLLSDVERFRKPTDVVRAALAKAREDMMRPFEPAAGAVEPQ